MCPVHIIYTLSQHAAITKPCSYVKAPTLQIPPDNKSPSKELSKTLGLLPASLPFSSAAATQELPALRPPQIRAATRKSCGGALYNLYKHGGFRRQVAMPLHGTGAERGTEPPAGRTSEPVHLSTLKHYLLLLILLLLRMDFVLFAAFRI